MRVVTFKIDDSLLDELDKFCAQAGLPRSECIRQAIKQMLRNGLTIKPMKFVRRKKVILT